MLYSALPIAACLWYLWFAKPPPLPHDAVSVSIVIIILATGHTLYIHYYTYVSKKVDKWKSKIEKLSDIA